MSPIGFEYSDFESAREAAAGVVFRTPSLPITVPGSPESVWLTLETLQPTGSFKLRGVFECVRRMSPEDRARGLSTVSAGNTATALAWVARHFGVRAVSRMPERAPRTKVDAFRALGGEPLLVPTEELFRFLREREWQQHPECFVHPWTDPHVHLGHGTLGLQIAEDHPDVDTVCLPVGGGGLLAGVGRALRTKKPGIRVVAVEPAACPSLAHSLDAGRAVAVEHQPTLCDGVAVPFMTAELFPILAELVTDVVLVSEEEVRRAMHWLLTNARLVVEGAGALAFAAAWKTPLSERGRTVCPLTGGNVDPSVLRELLTRS